MKIRFYDPDDEAKQAQQPARALPVHNQPHPQSRGFTLDWVRDLGWRENPFTQLQPKPVHSFIVGQEQTRQAINLFFIKEQRFGTITGERGSGKSFLLEWLEEELAQYADRFDIRRVSGAKQPREIIAAIVEPYEGVFSKYKGESADEFVAFLTSKLKKKLVLLIDDADELGAFESYVHALLTATPAIVVLAGARPKAVKDDALKLKLSPLPAHDAIKLVEKRIAAVGGSAIRPFTNRLLEELWTAAKENPSTYLSFLSETAMKIALKQVIIDEESPQEFLLRKQEGKEKAEAKPADTKGEKSEKGDKRAKNNKNHYDELIAGLAK